MTPKRKKPEVGQKLLCEHLSSGRTVRTDEAIVLTVGRKYFTVDHPQYVQFLIDSWQQKRDGGLPSYVLWASEDERAESEAVETLNGDIELAFRRGAIRLSRQDCETILEILRSYEE